MSRRHSLVSGLVVPCAFEVPSGYILVGLVDTFTASTVYDLSDLKSFIFFVLGNDQMREIGKLRKRKRQNWHTLGLLIVAEGKGMKP